MRENGAILGVSVRGLVRSGWVVGVVQKFRQGRRLSSSDNYAHALWLFSFCFIGRALEKNMPTPLIIPANSAREAL